MSYTVPLDTGLGPIGVNATLSYSQYGRAETTTHEATSVEYLVNGDEYFPRFFEYAADLVDAARSGGRGKLRMHAYRMSPDIGPDGAGSDITLIDALARLATIGAELDVTLSPHLRGWPNREPMQALLAAGVDARWGQGSLKYASHEKFALFGMPDRVHLMMGSLDPWKPRWDDGAHLPYSDRRFGSRIEPTHDVGLDLRLEPESYEEMSGVQCLEDLQPYLPSSVELLHHRSRPDQRSRLAIQAAFDAAEQFVYIEDQYFLPDVGEAGDSVLRAMERAIQRGVHFLVVAPSQCHPASPRAHIELRSEQMLSSLRDATTSGPGSITVLGRNAIDPSRPDLRRRLYIHSKVTIVDDQVAFVGSQNFTTRSMLFDDELTAIVRDESVVGGLRSRLWREHFPGITFTPGDVALGALAQGVDVYENRVVELLPGRTPRVWRLGNGIFRRFVDPSE